MTGLPVSSATPTEGAKQRAAAQPTLPRAEFSGARRFDRHLFYKAADAVLTAPLRSERALTGALGDALESSSANYERVAALVQAADRLWPGLASRLSRSLLRLDGLPLVYDQLTLLGYGSGATVFLMQRGSHRWVLKIYRRSLGRRPQGLAQIGAHFLAKYRTVAAWYAGPGNLVPPATLLMMDGPLLGCPAVALVQPYIDGEKYDLFLDFNASELLALLRSHPTLCRQFRLFARRTLDIFEQEGRCMDFIGRQNVMLNAVEDSWHLWVIDNGIFEIQELQAHKPDVHSIVLQRMEYLKSLYEKSLAFARAIGRENGSIR